MGRIVIENLTKSFGPTEVIPPLDLTIEDGEFAVFVGPSGCGKSTLLRLIAGLEESTSGKISIDGKQIAWVKFMSELNKSSKNEYFYCKRTKQLNLLNDNLRSNFSLNKRNVMMNYFVQNPKAGSYEVKLEFFGMNLRADGLNDLGPEPLATGQFTIVVDESSLASIKALDKKPFEFEDWTCFSGFGDVFEFFNGRFGNLLGSFWGCCK